MNFCQSRHFCVVVDSGTLSAIGLINAGALLAMPEVMRPRGEAVPVIPESDGRHSRWVMDVCAGKPLVSMRRSIEQPSELI
jgi:hypothetical protein